MIDRLRAYMVSRGAAENEISAALDLAEDGNICKCDVYSRERTPLVLSHDVYPGEFCRYSVVAITLCGHCYGYYERHVGSYTSKAHAITMANIKDGKV